MRRNLEAYTYFSLAKDIRPEGGGPIPVYVRAPAPPSVASRGSKGQRRDLTHFVFHSPDGFQYGYPGSGPADLALAILAHALQEQPRHNVIYSTSSIGGYRLRCLAQHQSYKDDIIARLPKGQPFTITGKEVLTWLNAHPWTPPTI